MLRFLYLLGIIAVALPTLIGLLAPVFPQCELPNHFRPILALGALALIAFGFAVWPTVWPLAAIGLATVNVTLLAVPLLAVAPPAAGDGERLKLVSFNLWTTRRYDDIERYLAQEDPDIVFLQELQRFHAADLLPRLKGTFPYQAICAGCGVGVLSKRPMKDVDTSGELRLVTGVWTSSDGQDYRIAGVHLPWPFQPEEQERDAARLAEAVTDWREPVIVSGDFNLTPWSWKLNRLLWRANLVRHGTFARSWPVSKLFRHLRQVPVPPLLLIDNVLTTPRIASEGFKVGPALGSDHRPIAVTLRLPK